MGLLENRIILYGVILLAAGLILRFWVNNRRFKRRSVTGLQQFNSYGQAMTTTFFEKYLKILSFGLVLFGGLMIALAVTGKSNNEKISTATKETEQSSQ